MPELSIIPLETWLRPIKAMESNSKGSKVNRKHAQSPRHGLTARVRSADALLTGIIFCGHCGTRLSANAGTYRNKRKDGSVSVGKVIKYECQTHTHRGREFCDGQRTYGQRRLETTVLSQLEQLLTMMDPEELTLALRGKADTTREEAQHQLSALENELKKTERVLSGWLSRMDNFLASPDE